MNGNRIWITVIGTVVGGFLLAVLVAGVTRCTRTHDAVIEMRAKAKK